MKILFSVCLLVIANAANAFEQRYRCELQEANLEANEKSYVVVDIFQSSADRYQARSITLVEADGETVELFAQSNRGGYAITYCHRQENEFSRITGNLSISSQCSSPTSEISRLLFRAHLGLHRSGEIKTTRFLNDGTVATDLISLHPCALD